VHGISAPKKKKLEYLDKENVGILVTEAIAQAGF
jgi:hypothetical protein